MLFTSAAFAILFAVVWILHWSLPTARLRAGLIAAASLVFYGWWDWRFVSLLLLSIVVDFCCGLALGRTERNRSRRLIVGISLATNLGVLGFFKYAGFFADSLQVLFDQIGFHLNPFTLNILLPMGISFYTFQTLGYTIDVYRRRVEPTRDLIDFAAYVTFFAQLVAGPIERAGRLLPQLQADRKFDWNDQFEGALLFTRGLFKKVVVADNLALLVDYSFGTSPENLSPLAVLFSLYAFTIQIYGDFGGYSDMAVGSARCLGIDLMRNFRAPFLAASPKDLWQRWHISLSTWLRDYLYIPLGGNRGSALFNARNLMATMVLGGLWHGAAWTFVVWGAFHGTLLVLHRGWQSFTGAAVGAVESRGGVVGILYRIAAVFVMFHLTCLSFLVFRAESLSQVFGMLARFTEPLLYGTEEATMLATVLHFSWMIVLLHALTEWSASRRVGGSGAGFRTSQLDVPRLTALLLTAAMLLRIFEEGRFASGKQFIYFQF